MVMLRRQFTWLVVVVSVVGLVRLAGGVAMGSMFESELARIATAQRANQAVLQYLTDAETGVRGYQLTGDPTFLQPYTSGIAAYHQALRTVVAAEPAPQVRDLLGREDSAAQRWLTGFARPIAATPAGHPGLDAQLSGRGKTMFDELRAANAAVDRALLNRSRLAVGRFRTGNNILEAALALLTGLSVLVALRLSTRTHRLLIAPLGHIQQVLQRRAAGDRSARADQTGPPEIRRVVAALNSGLDAADHARNVLADQKAYLVQVLDALNIAVLTCDTDGNLVHVNRAASRSAAVGPMPTTVAGLADPVAATTPDGTPVGADDYPVIRALAGETITAHETTVTAAGRSYTVLINAQPLRDAAGTIVGAVMSIQDISALRERDSDLRAFAAVAAHDLKAPLTTITGFSEILDSELCPDRQTCDPVALRPVVARIRTGSERMRGLIDDLLAYA